MADRTSPPSPSSTGARNFPVQVTIIAGVSTRLPNPPGNGGCIVTNEDLQYSVDLSPTDVFVPDATTTVRAGSSTTWPEGTLWGRVTPGQSNAKSVEVEVLPGVSSLPQPPATANIELIGTIPVGQLIVVVEPSPAANQIVVTGLDLPTPVSSSVFVQGTQSGVSLPSIAASAQWVTFMLPAGGPDTSYTVHMTSTEIAPVYVWESVAVLAMPVYVDNSVDVVVGGTTASTFLVEQPPAGEDWAVTLETDSRVLAVSAQLNTSAAAANRLPYFWFVAFGSGAVLLQVPMSPGPIAASSTLIMSGAPTLGSPFMRAGDNRAIFPIGDILLPAGTSVQSATGALQSGDQWTGISLVLSSV